MIQPERIQQLNDAPLRPEGDYVLYWMQASQREAYNHALEYAVDRANELRLPLLVAFGLMDDYPEANERHYAFMLEGLRETAHALEERNIAFRAYHGRPDNVAINAAQRAALLVVDCGYLRGQRAWRKNVAENAGCRVVQVESDAVIPVETASDKEEYAARTIRPKLERKLDTFLQPLRRRRLITTEFKNSIEEGIDIFDSALLSRLKLDRSVGKTAAFTGGAAQAGKRLQDFIKTKLAHYAEERNDPANDYQSGLSPYLHFGQISPVQIILSVMNASTKQENIESFLDELIVRRELAFNFVFYNDRYDDYHALPEWALKTLERHQDDTREHIYTTKELSAACTHDPYWNAAMKEMLTTGSMKGYMRMYWGKKILEWSRSPEEAYYITLALNNTYFLDGRDANSYANVAWLYGKHDRPWAERPIFGTVRYMNAAGLKRKFDIERYVRMVDEYLINRYNKS